MKILLSAYACEPNKGSEPGVGWHWAVELSKLKHDVWVLTRANNKSTIEKEYKDQKKPDNLHFLYYDLPVWCRKWKKGKRRVHLYYLLWQWGAYRAVKKIHSKEKFDLVHHVTFVSVRQPSFMGNLGIPFIFGPVAGGESAPWRLRFHYGIRGFFVDALRDLVNFSVRFDPLMWMTYRQAQKIYVTSEQTKKIVPEQFHFKIEKRLAIGFDSIKGCKFSQNKSRTDIRILYVGNFLYWKGMGIGIRAFERLSKTIPRAMLTLVGEGPEEKNWKNIVKKCNIADRVDWIPWTPIQKLSEVYQRHHLFLFPSFHDSGGMVVLEAMGHGLPVICFDIGGPGEIVTHECGVKIAVGQDHGPKIIEAFFNALIRLSEDRLLQERLGANARERANKFRWCDLVNGIYNKS